MGIWNGFKNLFCLHSNISNDDIILLEGRSEKNEIFWSEIGTEFGEPGST